MAQPMLKKDDDREDEVDYHPVFGIEKGDVLQEARVFNDSQIDARRCSQVINSYFRLSAALVSGVHLLQEIWDNVMFMTLLSLLPNPEVVKRWSNKVQEAVQSRAPLVQFHALALLYQVPSRTISRW